MSYALQNFINQLDEIVVAKNGLKVGKYHNLIIESFSFTKKYFLRLIIASYKTPNQKFCSKTL